MASTATTFDTDCKLMLHMDGSDASTTFTDSSNSANTVTAVGTAQIDTAQSVFGGASGLFDGTCKITVPDSADWDLGTGDFTIEFRTRFSSVAGSFIDRNDQGFSIRMAGATSIRVDYPATPNVFNRAWSPSTGTWYHVALTRNGSNNYLFVDGTQLGATVSDSSDITLGVEVLHIGNSESVDNGFSGWLDELRWIKGTAVWTANFTPPTSAYAPPSSTKNLALLGIG